MSAFVFLLFNHLALDEAIGVALVVEELFLSVLQNLKSFLMLMPLFSLLLFYGLSQLVFLEHVIIESPSYP